MAGTTLDEDIAGFTRITRDFAKKPSGGAGNLIFAGNLWPPRARNSLKYRDVEYAFGEARSIIVKGYLAASAGIRGEAAASEKMKRWFGERSSQQGPAPHQPDWWLGARTIIGAIEDFILKNISVYYRGDQSLLGRPTDYPGEHGNLTQQDLAGYAESSPGVKNNIIGLCRLFFEKKDAKGQAAMNLKGKDSVGGTLIHELSHNICGTEDHQTYNDSGLCYQTAGCLDLATHKPSRAWYNADNIEYFCEDVAYGIP